ncbi:hypothetical protein MRS44_011144 [Fusarium solani]|uniref:PBP domain-containing protein n=1 Tax=Fusarium solani TaxID=169388 RepID=A0A9P9KU82_FUSSL|nr:uncharacterized protein B0J15DRAFT_231666 [Fusarium solani]KAH7268586.1 hypothetical protein B0J15DRAFT_231666 [Fusarium solani]KAJ3460277.1 hypothetical protein MRS44_011144 [Fusarium solani]
MRLFVVAALLLGTCVAVEPEAVYSGGFDFDKNDSIKLRIANGGAGQSGLIKELANAYIKDRVTGGEKPFQVAWIKSDTYYSIQYLKTGDADIGITYNEAAENISIKQGIAKSPSYYAFRDHFLLVGPKRNPAKLSESDDILTMFATLHEAAEGNATNPPVRFLSRYDKSATNIKETLLWAGIGQVPWATAYSTWYHQYIAFPIQALTAAILLNEYTITDRGTILSLDAELRNQTKIYKAGSDDADDLLLNPARALIGAKAPNADEAAAFVKWLVSDKGQDVIADFEKDGQQLYSRAPKKVTY